MNGPQTPVFMRNNSWTRLIERVSEQNAQEGKPAGRGVDQMAHGTRVVPASQSKRVADYVPPPEDPAVAMRANSRAAALGITSDGRIGAPAGPSDDGLSDAEIDKMLSNAGIPAPSGGPAPPEPPVLEEAPPNHVARNIPPYRSPVPSGRQAPSLAIHSMPDFTKVEGFDLERKVAIIDGVEFRLAEEDVKAMKRFAINVVLENVTYQLAQALVNLGIAPELAKTTAESMRKEVIAAQTPGGLSDERRNEAVSREVQANETAGRVSPEQEESGRQVLQMQGVHEDVQLLLGDEGNPEALLSDPEGDSAEAPLGGGTEGKADDEGSVAGDSEAPRP